MAREPSALTAQTVVTSTLKAFSSGDFASLTAIFEVIRRSPDQKSLLAAFGRFHKAKSGVSARALQRAPHREGLHNQYAWEAREAGRVKVLVFDGVLAGHHRAVNPAIDAMISGIGDIPKDPSDLVRKAVPMFIALKDLWACFYGGKKFVPQFWHHQWMFTLPSACAFALEQWADEAGIPLPLDIDASASASLASAFQTIIKETWTLPGFVHHFPGTVPSTVSLADVIQNIYRLSEGTPLLKSDLAETICTMTF